MKVHTKYILTLILASLILILSTYGMKYYLEVSAYNMSSQINTIEKNIYDGNLKLAKKEIEVLNDSWKSAEPIWSFLTNHVNLDHIVTSLENSITFMEFEDTVNTISSLRLLKNHIEHVPQIEEFNFKNIL